jgi:uncharacterized UBP type Zn finger protein
MSTYPYNNNYAVTAFGLHNVGNSCYFNSLVQSLLSCPIVKQYLQSLDDTNDIIDEYLRISNQRINHAGALLKALIDSTKDSKNTLHYNWQEDAHEGLVLLLDKIGQGIEHMFNVRYNVRLVCADCGKDDNIVEEKGASCEVFVDYYDDSVDLDKYIFSHCTTPEDYKCEKCESKNTTVYQKNLRRISTVVVLTMKKYHGKKMVNFPMNFTITGGTLKLTYKVVAQIEHSGSMNGGHYFARCLREDGRIYTCNDSSIVQIGKFEPTPNTYMVFYHLETKTELK